MTRIRPRTRPLLIALCIPLLTSCAGMEQISADSVLKCGAATLGGAVAGLAIGKASGSDNAGRDAAIGAVAGALACIAYEYQTRQVQTAQEVEKGYQKTAAGGGLPETTQVTAYNAKFQPGTAMKAGTQTTLVSDFTLVAGRNSPTPKVEESLDLYSPSGKKVSSARKDVVAANGSGGFQNQFKFKMPEGVPEGVYPVTLTLYADGAPLRTANSQIQIARNADGRMVASLR